MDETVLRHMALLIVTGRDEAKQLTTEELLAEAAKVFAWLNGSADAN